MDMTDPTFQMLAYELALIFGLLSAWLLFRAHKKNKQAQADAATAVKKIKRLKDRRIEQLTTILSEKYGLTGQALEQAAQEFQSREQKIYKAQLALFVEQDTKALKAAPTQLENAIDACLSLLPAGNDVSVSSTAETKIETSALTETVTATAVKVDELVEGFRRLSSGALIAQTIGRTGAGS